MSPILGCCLDEEGHMLTAQDGELAHRVPREKDIYRSWANWLSSCLRLQGGVQPEEEWSPCHKRAPGGLNDGGWQEVCWACWAWRVVETPGCPILGWFSRKALNDKLEG